MTDKPRNTPDGSAIDPRMLARAERAIAALNADFGVAVQNDIDEIRALIGRLAAAPDDAASLNRLLDIAHGLHGQGGSFDYPLISRIGAALCRFIERRNDASPGPGETEALHRFADAASAIVAGTVTGEGDAESRATVDNLETLADRAVGSTD